jgi:hypothetical protein
MGSRCGYVGITTGLPPIAADLLHRESRQLRAMSGREHCTKWYTTSLAAGFQGRSIDALLRICDRLTFTAGLSTGIVSYNRDGLVRRRMRFGRR